MPRVPDAQERVLQLMQPDKFGNVYYSKCLNLDERGFVKLSPRAVQVGSGKNDSDIGLPLAFGRNASGFLAVTSEEALEVDATVISLSVAQDSDSPPNLSISSRGSWWLDRWYVTLSSGLYYKASGSWTNASVSLTSGVPHPLEVFRSLNYLAIGNGNQVLLINTSHSTIITLTLPADYTVIDLVYQDSNLAIITKLSNVTDAQNQQAYLFLWSGATASAEVGQAGQTDAFYAATPYRGAFAVFDRNGRLQYWNGGQLGPFPNGLEIEFPFYRRSVQWSSSAALNVFGKAMTADGNRLFLNTNDDFDDFGIKGESHFADFPVGVLCLDMEVGIYHRYAPSVSQASMVKVALADVNISTDVMTRTTGTIPSTGSPMKYMATDTTLIGGLVGGKVYYCIKTGSTTFKLATSRANALANVAIDLTGQGNTNNYFLAIEQVDYGAIRSSRTGALALTGSVNRLFSKLIFGGDYYDYESSTAYSGICLIVDGFKNIGYFVTSRDYSPGQENNERQAFIKYRPLQTDDKIIVKHKNADILGIPVTTPQISQHCTWTSDREFYTDCDLSEVKNYLDSNADNECEVEIISGAAAGEVSQIESMTESNGRYGVVLKDALEGAAAGRISDIQIDNWKQVAVITGTEDDQENNIFSAANGYNTIPVAKQGKFSMYKVIMNGTPEMTIEEFLPDSVLHKAG